MNKPIIYSLITLLITHPALPREGKVHIDLFPEESGIAILQDDNSILQLVNTIDGFDLMVRETSLGSFVKIMLNGYTNNYHTGFPELPVLNNMIEIPPGAEPEVRIISYKEEITYLDEYNIPENIIPSQPPALKNDKPEEADFYYDSVFYQKDQYTSHRLVTLKEIGKTRGMRLAQLCFAPFQYNPVRNILKTYNNIRIEILFHNADITGATTSRKKYYSPVFEPVYHKILNHRSDEFTPSTYPKPIKYVILSDTLFRETLQPFIQWKTKKGFTMVEVYKGDPQVGNTRDELKTYLANLYHSATPEDPAPTYLLIVGDVEQIPLSQQSGQITDLYYAEYDGEGDYVPDVFYGRFSARDTTELKVLITKTLEYEQYLFPDPSFLNEVVLVAGVDGYYAPDWGNGQINYIHDNYLNATRGITSHTYPYPESGASAELIKEDISQGASFVNYTGHGYPDRWKSPKFTISDIPDLANISQYPLIITNGCSTATFDDPECLGEALVRAENKGALGYIGCTNDSYWDEDFYWAVGVGPVSAHPTYQETSLGAFDRLFHTNEEPREEWYTTQGQMVYAGNIAVSLGNINLAKYYWEIYHLLGDPSLMVYFSVPEPIGIFHNPAIPIGTDDFIILTEPYTYVAISIDSILIDAGYADETGEAKLSLPELINPGTIDLVATKQNREPYFSKVDIISNIEPFVFCDGFLLNDSLGNANNKADYGEQIYLSIDITNIGQAQADSLEMILSCTDTSIIIMDSLAMLNSLPGLSDTSVRNAFVIKIRNTVNNKHVALFRLNITDNQTHHWTSYFQTGLSAPEWSIGKLTIKDKAGNGNGKPDPGETAEIRIEATNTGNSTAENTTGFLRSNSDFITVIDSVQYLNTLDPGETLENTFLVSIDSSAAYNSQAILIYQLAANHYSISDTFMRLVGLVYEDFESAGLSVYPWINDTVYPWFISDKIFFEGRYSARSDTIDDFGTSNLSITLDVYADDTISFYKKVSSESGYDYLRFFIDSVETDRLSGEKNWTRESYSIPEGIHTLSWKYTKDKSISHGYDCAWLDFISFPQQSFNRSNVGIYEILSPVSGYELTQAETITVTVKNYGSDPAGNIPAGYRVNLTDPVFDTIIPVVLPDSVYLLNFSVPADFSKYKEHNLSVFTALENDEYRGNDTLSIHLLNSNFMDAGITSLVSPSPDTIYSGSEKISVRIRNFGSLPVSGLTFSFMIDNQDPVVESPDSILQPGDSLIYTFKQTADLSEIREYELTVFISYAEDEFRANDTVKATLHHTGIIDGGVLTILTPDKDSAFSETEEISVSLRNYGTVSFSNAQLTYRIDSLDPVTEMVDSTLQPGDSLVYTFHHTADMSAYGSYRIIAWSTITGDTVHNNDTTYLAIEHKNLGAGDIENIPFKDLQLFPNPGQGVYTLSFRFDGVQTIELQVFNLSGQVIFNREFKNQSGFFQYDLNINHYEPGFYILLLKTNNNSTTEKLIKY